MELNSSSDKHRRAVLSAMRNGNLSSEEAMALLRSYKTLADEAVEKINIEAFVSRSLKNIKQEQ
jgi:hypothetical protein